MLENPPDPAQRIIQCLRAEYGLDVNVLQYLPLGADLSASVYKAKTQDKKSYFIKIKHNYNHAMSLAITRLLQEAGIEQIILPVKSLRGDQSCSLDPSTLIVYPFIEGEDGFKRDLTMEQWFLLGKALRRIHSLAVPAILQNRMGRETYSKTWRETVRALLRRVEEGFTVHDEIAHGLKAFLMEKRDLIQKLVDRAEALGQKLKDMPSEYVLCHADIHGGNVLIDRNNAIYIIDWDEPMMAPKERDLMFIGGGVANVWNKPEEVQWFYQGYGATEINKTQLAYYRHERIVEDIADFCQELLIAPASGADKQTMLKQFIGMFQPKGVVDIAFKSDEDLLL